MSLLGTKRLDCRESPIRLLSEAQRTCREVVGRVDPTLLTRADMRGSEFLQRKLTICTPYRWSQNPALMA
jgi:hypothetical protein